MTSTSKGYALKPDTALEYFSKNKNRFLEELKELARIPSVSFAGFPASEVDRCAEAVAKQMKANGLENVEVIRVGKAHPYVYADWLHAPGKPTVLLYAHHDVQPIGNEALWKTPPFEPTQVGERLFGRGTADDKAGISVHVAAIASYLKSYGKLPLNVKIIIEGEEEIGSDHLGAFVSEYREKLSADAMILTDTSNFDTGIPALTVSLRGLVCVDVEVKALEHSLHSGMWGGPIPDPAMALSKMLSALTDDDGRLAIPGMCEGMEPLTAAEEKAFEELPYDESEFRKASSLLLSVPLRPHCKHGSHKTQHGGAAVYTQLWREPSVAVNAVEVGNRKQAGNIIAASAWARVGVRIVAGMDPEKSVAKLESFLREKTPWGLQVTIHRESAAKAWGTKPQGPAFDSALQALEFGYGKKPVFMGMGGTIPFVEPLSTALGGVPALLMGVEDPYTNAHSENESLHLGDWEKAIRSAIYFYSIFGGEL